MKRKKCLISFQFLASVLSSIPIGGYTPVLNRRDDLSENERELCLQTSKFEHFIHEFFNKYKK
jgi:proteasome activator subunit 4